MDCGIPDLAPGDAIRTYEETGAVLRSLDRCIEETRTVLDRNPACPAQTRNEILDRVNRLRRLAHGRLSWNHQVKSPALLKTSLRTH